MNDSDVPAPMPMPTSSTRGLWIDQEGSQSDAHSNHYLEIRRDTDYSVAHPRRARRIGACLELKQTLTYTGNRKSHCSDLPYVLRQE